MDASDPHLNAWAIGRLQETQAQVDHVVFDLGVESDVGIPGAGGVSIASEDNRQGLRTLFVTARPVLLGQVELIAELITQAPDKKPHKKIANLSATPDALRDLARVLLDAADAADDKRPRPQPVR